MENKNTMLLTVVAVATLLVAVVGATFAFFTADNTISGTTTVTTTTEKIGAITISNPTTAISMKLTAADMDEASKGSSYWATTTSANHVSTAEHNAVSRLKVENGETGTTYNCSYTLTLTKPTLVKAGDAAIILTLTGATISGVTSGEEIDLYAAKTSYTVNFSQTGNIASKDLVKVAIKYNNTTSNQDYLAGQTLTTTLANSNISCTIAG